jgi:DNA repair/transcription protein MET18/MMS19
VRADVVPQVFGAGDDCSALGHYASLAVWVFKALAMRPDPSTHSGELMQQVIQLLTSGNGSPQAADQLAYAMQDILPDDELILTADGRCRISLLWKQRLFTQLFKPLFEAFQSHRTSSKMACLVVLCTVSGIVPKAVLSNDMESVSTAVIQAMAALSNPAGHEINQQQREALTSRALETLEVLLEHSQDTVALHLKTIIPVLLTAAQSAATARSRAAAIRCLLELTHLTYAVLHPYKQTVLNGLKVALDDKKKGVRRLAAKARNEWAVLGSVPV